MVDDLTKCQSIFRESRIKIGVGTNFNTSDASIIWKPAGDLSFSVDEGSKLVRIKKISWHPWKYCSKPMNG